ncbi:hypothetical protein SAMN04487934_1071 [Eubacterium ruminantium]|nr:hypothetical protein SAMN04487934_1071 [Eubacterium ruminantium]
MRKKRVAKRLVAFSVSSALALGLLPGNYIPLYENRIAVVQAASEQIIESFSADEVSNLGADSHFALGSSIVVDSNSKTFDVNGESTTVTSRIKLGLNTFAETNAIKVTVDEGYTATLDVYAISSNGSTGASLNIFDSDGNPVFEENATMAGSSGNSVQGFTFEGIPAGTYYIASNDSSLKPANIYYVSMVEEPAGLEDKILILNADENPADNEFFTLGSSIVVDSNTKTFDVDGESLTVASRIKLGKNTFDEANAIGFTVEEGYKGTIDVYAISSNGTTGASVNIFGSDGSPIFENNAVLPGSTGASVEKLTFEDIEAGNYFIASNDSSLKPANVYYVILTETDASGGQEEEKKDWAKVAAPEMSLEVLTDEETGKKTFNIGYKMVIGTEGADSVKIRVVKPDETEKEIKNDKAENDGTEFSYVSYSPDMSGKYTVYVEGLRSGEDNKTVSDEAAFLLPLATAKVTAIPDNESVDVIWSAVPEADSYTLQASIGEETVIYLDLESNVNRFTVTGLENDVEYGFRIVAHRETEEDNETISELVTATPEAPEEGVSWFSANKCEVQTVSGEYVYPENESLSIMNGVAVQACDAVTATDGKIFIQRFSAGAAPKDAETGTFHPDEGKSYKLTLTEESNVKVYCKSSGDAERVLRLADAEGNTIKDFTALPKNSDLIPSTAVNLEAGTYYFYSTNSTVYLFGVKVKEGKAPRKAWDEVSEPSITNVERTEEGLLNVTFEGEFGDDGADVGRVFMYQDGFEVSSVAVSASGTVSFKPTTNGDFTFDVVISREKCADKASEEVSFNDYLLPPEAPFISWIDNLGDGSVYVDWNNVTPDQGCDVYLKASDESEFTLVSTGVKAGNYTFTGLTYGKTYAVAIEAKDSVTGNSTVEREFTVGDPVQEWYVDDFGSATSGKIKVNDNEVTVGSYTDLYMQSEHKVADVTDGTGEILMSLDGSKNGKIADSEEGIQAYYTRINPNTENFKLTATFELASDAILDNQSGFGIYALDIAGLGTKDAKYMNSVAVGNFKLKQDTNVLYHGNGVRVVTGYSTYDPTSTAGSGRNLDNTKIFVNQPADTSTLVVGEKFTYTLEKTDEGFIASMGDETIFIPDVKSIMQQEDGSIVVAVASGRCDAKITDIHFEKSEGSVSGGTVIAEITPAVSMFSSNITTSGDYEFIAGANVPGTFKVYNGNEEIDVAGVDEKTVAKIPVELWNAGGANELRYVFTPDSETPNLSSYEDIENTVSVTWNTKTAELAAVYTAPDAPADGEGTKKNPVDLQVALNNAVAGQTIVMLDGTYYPTKALTIPRNVRGTVDKEITLMAETTGGVVISGENLTSGGSILDIVGDYWHIYGIEFCDSPAKGVSVCGNYNTVEMCVMHRSGNSGLQISRYAGEPNDQEMWPTSNLIKNCESYDNCDAGRNDADGFAAKLTCGKGNVFDGCISHHNIDDGWDLYAKSTTGEIGSVMIMNSVAYSNGWLTTDDPTDPSTSFGEGNGFKLGGENMYGGHILYNSVSFNNYAKGITSNSCPDCMVYKCTAFNNSLNGKAYNVSLYTKSSNTKAWDVYGMLSIATNGKTNAELGSENGVIYSLKSDSNFFFNGSASVNSKGEEATTDWFENVDVSVAPTRNEDGSIDMHGLLVLKDEYKEYQSGADLSLVNKPSVKPEIPENKPEITTQPADTKVIRGSKAKFSVAAEGTDLKYKWQNSVDGETWVDSKATGYDTKAISFKATDKLNGRYFRCIVTSAAGDTVSEPAQLTTVAVVSAQPKNAAAYVGDNAVFTLKSRSSVATFEWQISKDGGETWKKSGAEGSDTTSLTIPVKLGSYNGYMFRCKVTNGTWVEYTNAATLTVKPKITTQQANVTAYYGDLVKLSIKTSGTAPAYQWQVQTASGAWKNSTQAGNDTSILRFTSVASLDGRKFRCKVVDNGITIYSNIVSFTAKSPIVTQPKSVSVKAGGTAKFTAKVVVGDSEQLTTNWQFSNDGGKTWNYVKYENSGFDTQTLTLSKVAAAKSGWKIRLRVKNRTTVTYSDVVDLTVK